MDKTYVRYQGRYKKKNPARANGIKKYQFKKGESGQTRLGKTAVVKEGGEVLWEGETIPALGNPDYVIEKKREMTFKKGESGSPERRWKPRESGNLEGRPVGSVSLVERLKAYLRRHPEEADKIVARLVTEGKMGNIIATKEMLDRIDGKVAERHKIEGELPVKLLFVPAQEVLEIKEEDPAPKLLEEG